MRQLVIVGNLTPTNVALLAAFRDLGRRASLLPASALASTPAAGNVYLGRLDVKRSLDGIEEGLEELRELETKGARVLNPPAALFRCHDKLTTALALHGSGIPHPQTELIDVGAAPPPFGPPYVVKPRFGSWGRDVVMCENRRQLKRTLARLSIRPWFRANGALVQELVPAARRDLRLVVAGGQVVGAIARVAPAGEWRTNIALGGSRQPVVPSTGAMSVALDAAEAVGGDLVGVDLVATGASHTVIEVNGCVDFTAEYAPHGDAFARAASALVAVADELELDQVASAQAPLPESETVVPGP
jgi:[lysine-biosynthesis-protein LysW]--L-2-aminoadipate ligase